MPNLPAFVDYIDNVNDHILHTLFLKKFPECNPWQDSLYELAKQHNPVLTMTGRMGFYEESNQDGLMYFPIWCQQEKPVLTTTGTIFVRFNLFNPSRGSGKGYAMTIGKDPEKSQETSYLESTGHFGALMVKSTDTIADVMELIRTYRGAADDQTIIEIPEGKFKGVYRMVKTEPVYQVTPLLTE